MNRSLVRRRHAFTLIELLVVVAIIALLISILLPSLSAARKQGKSVVCLSNLRSQGAAQNLYKEDNNGVFACGLISNMAPDATRVPSGYQEYGTTHWSFLPYLNYQIPTEVMDKPRIAERYKWHYLTPEYGVNFAERLARVYELMDQYQCPDHPVVENAAPGPDQPSVSTGVLDYISNAMPIPFAVRNAKGGNLQVPDPDSEAQGVPLGTVDYWGTRRDTNVTKPSQFIYVTEAHESLAFKAEVSNFRFHAFFLGHHLPQAGNPRIANDQRHPGGINALYFDGHAKTNSMAKMDPGWPNSLGIRLQQYSDPTLLKKGRW